MVPEASRGVGHGAPTQWDRFERSHSGTRLARTRDRCMRRPGSALEGVTIHGVRLAALQGGVPWAGAGVIRGEAPRRDLQEDTQEGQVGGCHEGLGVEDGLYRDHQAGARMA